MNKRFKLLAVLAHPDDESLGFGGTLAKYAAEGVETYLVTATRGERGRFGSLGKGGDPVEVGRVREAELRAAAAVLGIREVSLMNYPDSALDQIEATTAIRAVVSHIRRIQPDVVVTFGPEGAYGHPDHIAISQFTTAATVCAADAEYRLYDGLQEDSPPPWSGTDRQSCHSTTRTTHPEQRCGRVFSDPAALPPAQCHWALPNLTRSSGPAYPLIPAHL